MYKYAWPHHFNEWVLIFFQEKQEVTGQKITTTTKKDTQNKGNTLLLYCAFHIVLSITFDLIS